MRVMMGILVVVVSCSARIEPAYGQSQSPLIDSEGMASVPPTSSYRLTTYQSESYKAVRSRLELLRSNTYWRTDNRGLLRPEMPPMSPVRRVLNYRNLLRSRSMLGTEYTSLLGRFDYLSDPRTGQYRGAIDRWRPDEVPEEMVEVDPLAPVDDHFTTEIEDRLVRKANEQFDRGMAFFRYGDMLSARDCFQMVRDVERDRPRAYVADVFVSYRRDDYSRAVVSLLQAVDRVDTADQLKIDGFLEKFFAYGDDGDERSARREFQRLVESVNLYRQHHSDALGPNALFAYVSWLNGDEATAVSAANQAIAMMDASVEADAAREEESGSRETLVKLAKLLSEPRSETPSPAQE